MPGIRAFGSCPAPQFSGGGIALQSTGAKVARGQTARWQATAPSGLQIVAAGVPSSLVVAGVNDGSQYGGGFYWSGGGASVKDAQSSALLGGFASPYFGVQLICGVSSCTNGENQIDIGEIVLSVRETSGLKIVAPDDLWQASGWLRGSWTLHYEADSPSGVCGLSASLNGQAIEGSLSGQNVAVWHQCAAPAVSRPIDLDRYGQGPLALVLQAADAAGSSGSVTKTVNVDPTSPTLTLSGPTDAPSTAGTQFVSASAGGSPSGIEGMTCSVDGDPSHWYPGSTAQVPVSGVGAHAVSCVAANNAVDQAGNHGWSATQTRTLTIRIPTVSGIAFSRIVDALSCHRSRVSVLVPAHWVNIRLHHRLVRVKVGASHGTIERTRCHPRTARRSETVWVTVRRHGKKVRVKRRVLKRVVLVPHLISRATREVAHGHRATVDGWLGTSAGIALPSQPVWILTAADNGLGHFRLAATTTTASNGSWQARLPAGPSRLVEAVYPGGPTTEPSTSGQVNVVVPAKVELLNILPGAVAWGGTVRITGMLAGGYLPSAGALVRLRIGLGKAFTTYGVHEHITGNGRFTTSYTFGAGEPSAHRSFWFQIGSLPVGDYPYAAAESRRRFVLVGGHPRTPRAHHRQAGH